MLILKCQNEEAEEHEVCSLESICKLMGITPTVELVSSAKQLNEILKKGVEYNFIYLSAHGDAEVFASEDFAYKIQWREFGNMLCATGAMAEDCIIMLSCCRGGLAEVAYTLFYMCNDVQYVVGPRQNLSNCELSTAFHIFMFNYMERNIDPVTSCKKVSKAIDTRINCYDRLETRAESSYMKFVEIYFDQAEPEVKLSAEAESIIEKAGIGYAEFIASSGDGRVCCPEPPECEN